MKSKENPARKITGYLRDSKLSEITDMSKTTIWRLRKEGKFPKKVWLSTNISGTAQEDVDDWLQDPEGWPDKQNQGVAA